MKNDSSEGTANWWEEREPVDTAFVLSSIRAERSREHLAGWRRNIQLALLVIAIPVLIRLATNL